MLFFAAPEAQRREVVTMTVNDDLLRNEAATDFRPLERAACDSGSNTPCGVDWTDCVLEEEACFIGISYYVSQLKTFVVGQAARQQPVLLFGEQGLRREQVARAIHQLSEKPSHTFRMVDTRSHSETSLYELLFAPGGLVEACQEGTIFIDEAAKLSLPLLYRFALPLEKLQQRAHPGLPVGPRLILALNESGPEQISKGDPFNQVMAVLQPAVFRLRPLRERSEDIPYLVIYLADRIACRLDKGRHNVSPEVMRMLAAYDWEGNIDELETVLESVIAHTPPPEINETLLPARIHQARLRKIPKAGINLFQAVDEYERELIAQALQQAGGKQSAAAQLLGIRPQTLNTKLKRSHDLNLEESD
jgi:DNA-binding NtrC family response regulator